MKVNGCWDCPFKKKVYGVVPGVGDMSGSESTMRYVCALKEKEGYYCLGYEFKSDWIVSEIAPEWCPLYKEPLVIEQIALEVEYERHQIMGGFKDREVFDLTVWVNGRLQGFRKDPEFGNQWTQDYFKGAPVPEFLVPHLNRIYNELQPK